MKDELIMGSLNESANFDASSALSAIPNLGNGIFNSVNNSEKRPLSSAKSKASNEVPKDFDSVFR
jgi:hypothetical protein